MRRICTTALLAVPLFLLATTNTGRANTCPSCQCGAGFGCGDWCFRLFPHIHQHGPLFNYGPYYGYYPFTPYGPWDSYLRYNPFFYGDPYANFNAGDSSGRYGCNPHLHKFALSQLFHKQGCSSCGFWHASWLHGGWFRGHSWVNGFPGLSHKPHCSSCGGVGVALATEPTGDVLVRYSGLGSAAQSAVYYPTTPTLDPALELIPTAGQAR
jgi:hypothetical protein